MDTGIGTRRASGCLAILLAVALIVTCILFASSVFMLTVKVFGLANVDPATQESATASWFSIVVCLGFSFPVLVVLTRALYAAIVHRLTGRRIMLVTWQLLLPASVLLGVPGLVIAALGTAGVIDVSADLLPWALFGAGILVVGPFVLWKVERSRREG